MDETAVIGYFLGLLDQIKLAHWATMSYAKHKALDDLHDSLSKSVDLFVEAYIGRFKKQPLKKVVVEMRAESDLSIEKFVEAERDRIDRDLCKKAFLRAPELQNILQEMMADMDRALYLLKLD